MFESPLGARRLMKPGLFGNLRAGVSTCVTCCRKVALTQSSAICNSIAWLQASQGFPMRTDQPITNGARPMAHKTLTVADDHLSSLREDAATLHAQGELDDELYADISQFVEAEAGDKIAGKVAPSVSYGERSSHTPLRARWPRLRRLLSALRKPLRRFSMRSTSISAPR